MTEKISYPFFFTGSRRFRKKCKTRDVIIQQEAIKLFETHGKGATSVLDLGANRGNFSIIASQYSDNVIAVEPHPLAFKVLTRSMPKNVQLINAAAVVDSAERMIQLDFIKERDPYRTLYKSESSSTVRGKKDLVQSHKMNVETIDIRDLLDLVFFDVIKMDIEGAELSLLPYLASHNERFGKLFVELHTGKFTYEMNFAELATDLPKNIFTNWI